jgi:hypothetical protein
MRNVVVKNQSEPTQILIVLYIHASTRSSPKMGSRYYIMNVEIIREDQISDIVLLSQTDEIVAVVFWDFPHPERTCTGI